MKRIFFNSIKSFVMVCLCVFILSTLGLNLLFSQETPEDKKIREKYEKIGKEEIRKQFDAMQDHLLEAGRSVGKDGRFLVSTDVINLRNVVANVKNNIIARRNAIKKLIWQVANDIEAHRSTGVKLDPSSGTLAYNDLERVKRLQDAIQKNSVSLRSLAVSIRMVVDVSKALYKKALAATNPELKSNLYIEYTAFAYELSTIVIELISNYEQEGRDELEKLYSERKLEVERLKGRINNRKNVYKNRLENGQISKKAHDEKIKQFTNMEEALDATLVGWNTIFKILGEQEKWAQKIRSKKQIFIDIRDDAGLQLDLLAEIRIAREVLSYFKSIEEITEIAEIPLLTIDGELAKVLLGINTKIPSSSEIRNNTDRN
ncbi:MAG: hypothetical protein JSV88_14735 [Candidatus Aminicenantes bacterium]|nr:MAG: hypothetical protein JSV88_14735 [Candidatus Aminicenantes bacterium]